MSQRPRPIARVPSRRRAVGSAGASRSWAVRFSARGGDTRSLAVLRRDRAYPARPAATMINGNGTARKYMATKAAVAVTTRKRSVSARRLTRTRAAAMMATTAGARP